MEGKKTKEKGGAEKARKKKKRMLEEDASKCSKITDLFRRNQASTSAAVSEFSQTQPSNDADDQTMLGEVTTTSTDIEEDALSVNARDSEASGSRIETETDEDVESREDGPAEKDTSSVPLR